MSSIRRTDQHVGPHRGQLRGGARVHWLGRAGLGGSRERGPVDLAVGVQRQLGQHNDLGRDHVVRQGLPQFREHLGGLQRYLRYDIADQPPALRLAGHGHGRLHHGRQQPQRGLDLAQLDAEAAQLDLAVRTADELDCPVRQPASEVTGAVVVATVEGDELLLGELRAVDVAERNAVAADVQLAGLAQRDPVAVLSSSRMSACAIGRPIGTVGSAEYCGVASSVVANVVVSVGPYTFSRRAGRRARMTARAAAGSITSPPTSKSRRPAKVSGAVCAWAWNSAVVTNIVVIPASWMRCRRSGADSSTSRSTPTSVAPLSSAPQISNVAASKEALEAAATTSSGPSVT